ncbi:MAG: hypothetical protein L0H93_07350 [Nocardioides sp.]|nr:hypothetical protein [Nocardioides sp.]
MAEFVSADLEEAGVRDQRLVEQLTALKEAPDQAELDADTAADIAIGMLLKVQSLPQPTDSELATFPEPGELRRRKDALDEALRDPHNVANMTTRGLLRAALRPRRRKA